MKIPWRPYELSLHLIFSISKWLSGSCICKIQWWQKGVYYSSYCMHVNTKPNNDNEQSPTVYCSIARNAPPGSCSCHEEQRGHAPRHRSGQSRLAKAGNDCGSRRGAHDNGVAVVAAAPWLTMEHTIRDQTAAAAIGEEVGGSGGHHQPKSNEHSLLSSR